MSLRVVGGDSVRRQRGDLEFGVAGGEPSGESRVRPEDLRADVGADRGHALREQLRRVAESEPDGDPVDATVLPIVDAEVVISGELQSGTVAEVRECGGETAMSGYASTISYR